MNKKERLLSLIESLSGIGLDRRRVERLCGLSKNYLDRAVSTGVVSDKALEALDDLWYKKAHIDVNVGNSLRRIEKKSDVILIALSEVLSNQRGGISKAIHTQFERMVNELLNSDQPEQSEG
ncbi:MAG: hypothetical protein ACREHG_00325 [Candidatus Saccharimonadales bacterium]